MLLIQPRRLLGKGGVRSCSLSAPRYVLGAYCLGNFVRSMRKTAKKAMAKRKVGTSVERSCEADADASRDEPTFWSSFALVLTYH